MSSTPSIWWIRRDLRLADNAALNAALLDGGPVIPLYVFDPNEGHHPEIRRSFLIDGLNSLAEDLEAIGGRLIVRTGLPDIEIPRLAASVGAHSVFAEEEFAPAARKRDTLVATKVELRLMPGLTVHHPSRLIRLNGEPYRRFTPFKKFWSSLTSDCSQSRPDLSLNTPPEIKSEALPDSGRNQLWPAGERAATERLQGFADSDVGKIWSYGWQRDRLDIASTSGLSPYLRFGMLSASQSMDFVTALATGAEVPAVSSVDAWVNELAWRDYYQSATFHRPEHLSRSGQSGMRRMVWRLDASDLDRWKHGATGYPIVDASMRQLLAEGWIHNRARMIVASFLTKHLLIDWRSGADWFMRTLIDGDEAANSGGWQWVAGTGTDAAPFFRIFNPVLQGKKFDPEGVFVRKWLPELRQVPNRYIHDPWNWPLGQVRTNANCDYPTRIIEHGAARSRALHAYQQTRDRN